MKQSRFGLIARVAFLVVCIEIAAFSVLGWFYVNQFSDEIVKRTYARIERVGEMLATDELPISVISRKTLLSDLIGAPYLSGMAIGGNGRVIVATRPDYLGRRVTDIEGLDSTLLTQTDGYIRYFSNDSTLTAVQSMGKSQGGRPLYHIIFTISTADLAAKKKDIAILGIAGSLLFMLLTSLAIVYVAHKLITRRVNLSLRVLEKIENGALEERIPTVYDDELGRMQNGINSMTDELANLVHESQSAAIEIQNQKDLLDLVIQNAPIRVFWKDRSLRFVGCNTRFAQDAGFYAADEVIGKTDDDAVWSNEAELLRADDKAVMESGIPRLDYEQHRKIAGDKMLWISLSKVPLRNNDGEIIGILGIYSDITAKKHAEDEIRNLAYFDPLTSLPNRRLLIDRLEQALAASVRSKKYAALLMMDLDNFKDLNDSKGHDVGDLLLREVGMRICSSVRDIDTVARFGGDEFVIIVESLGLDEASAVHQAMKVAEKIRDVIDQKFVFKGVGFSHYITPSIGVTLFDGKTITVEGLLKQVDVALYQAKNAGRNSIRFFSPAMQTQIDARAKMASGLRRALDKNELFLYYQPQVDSKGNILGAEALLRWIPLNGDPVSPAQFIPLAEETGLIIPIGDWVIAQACDQLKAWEGDPETKDLTLAVNVSSYQFRQNDFVEQVRDHIDRSGIDPSRLKLELTESVVLSDVSEAVERMKRIIELGASFSLDDFGTGFSSLSYLKRLPLNQLKIDQAFIRDILTDPSDAAIVRAILAISESLGLNVIAEGVETEEQYAFLLEHGCRYYQGYYFGRPLPVENWTESVDAIHKQFSF